MTYDSNKDITSIWYNYLNLPTYITFDDGHMTEYVYDGAGTKRRAIYKVQSEILFAPVENNLQSVTTAEQLVVVSSKDYCDNHIYDKDGYLNTVLFDNGYISSGQYHFYIKDYQGNNRVVFDQNGDVEQVNHYHPYGDTFGEGLGTNEVQPYKYGGKEFDRMNGLDAYDFGARYIDSATGVWNGLDPMAEKYYNISPYAYCYGNPVLNIDPNGAIVIALDDDSRRNILNSLSIDEAKYVTFNENGTIDINNLNKSKSMSENFTALKTLANSETTYNFETASQDLQGNEFRGNNDVGYSGVTSVPNGVESPSIDNTVYIITSSFLSEGRQAENVAHEAYGHAYFFELSKTNKNIDPWHRYKTDAIKTWDNELKINSFDLIKVPINNNLENQINIVTKQAKINYNSRKK